MAWRQEKNHERGKKTADSCSGGSYRYSSRGSSGRMVALEHEEQLPPRVVEVAVIEDSGSERGAASGKTGDTVGAGSHFRDMGQNAGAAVTESAGKASPADSTSWRGDAEKALPEHPVSGEAGASGSSAIGRTAASPSAGHMGSVGHGGAGGQAGPGSDRGGGHVVLPAGQGAISGRMEMVLIPLCLLKGFLTGY